MPTTEILNPADQPTNSRRLLHELRGNLISGEYRLFALAVAFAKTGPLYRLQADIHTWKSRGGRTIAVFGINERGTSYQALDLALALFDRVYITYHPRSSFHPKCYFFVGDQRARAFIGSNNLTVGGTELNFESGVYLDYKLPNERDSLLKAWTIWSQLLPNRCPATVQLTSTILKDLRDNDLLLDEDASPSSSASGGPTTPKWKPPTKLGTPLPWVPPSPVPGGSVKPKKAAKKTATKKKFSAGTHTTTTSVSTAITSLVMQIRPHHNGEIFLSKTAVNQNPGFFGFPFSGWTTPKKAGNPRYPQRLPDPKVDIYVYGKGKKELLRLNDYSLNTVYYEPKSEIRITASPLVDVTPQDSIFIIHRLPAGAPRDYIIEIHTPESPEYQSWLDSCDQEMPSGGKTPRRFGWL